MRLSDRVVPLFAALALAAFLSGCNNGPATAPNADAETAVPGGKETAKAPKLAPPPAPSEPADETNPFADSAETTKPAPTDGPEMKNPFAESDQLADAGGAAVPPTPKTKPGEDPLMPAGEKRTSTAGWWRLVFSVNGQDVMAGLVKIGKNDDGKLDVTEMRTNQIVEPATLKKAEVADTSVHLFFKAEPPKVRQAIAFDMAATLADGVLRGNVQFDSPRQILARMVPLDEKDATDAALEKIDLGQTFGSQPLVQAMQSPTPVESLRTEAKTYRTSPVLYMVYDAVFQQAQELKLDDAALKSLAADFEKTAALWGERAQTAAKLNIGIALLSNGYHADFGRQKLAEAEKASPELAGKWKDLVEFAEKNAAVAERRQQAAEAWAQVRDDKDAGKGMAALKSLHEKNPTDPVVAYRLAEADRKQKQPQPALELFARLAALPQTEFELQGAGLTDEDDYVSPRKATTQLWEEVKGTSEGLDAYLDETYHKYLTAFLTDADKERKPTESPRVVLVELLTGATCPPCVAADVATEAVEESFPKTDAVVLRYHVHVPGPDPLTNADDLARLEYYQAQGTPTVLIDGGQPGFNVGGGYSGAPEIYTQLAGAVAAEAAEAPAAKVELTATADGGTLRIAVQATADAPADTQRLRLAIAERDLSFAASNGIRRHGMIVREMPGGEAGIAAIDGKFTFEQTVSVAKLRDRLVSYLDSFEKDSGYTFPVRPLALKHLVVVAFVQDDATKKVLQTAVVPIGATFDLPPLAAKDKKKAKPKPAADENPFAEKPDAAPKEEAKDAADAKPE